MEKRFNIETLAPEILLKDKWLDLETILDAISIHGKEIIIEIIEKEYGKEIAIEFSKELI